MSFVLQRDILKIVVLKITVEDANKSLIMYNTSDKGFSGNTFFILINLPGRLSRNIPISAVKEFSEANF